MDSILLSQEFQTLVPIFLLLLLIFVVLVIYLIYKIVMERKRKKLEQELEAYILNFLKEGDAIMNGKDMVNAALSGASQTAAGTGRQQEIAKLLGAGFQNLIHQSNGLVQLGQQLALAKALRANMQVGAEMVGAMQAAAHEESLILTGESSVHVQTALGGQVPAEEQSTASKQIDSPKQNTSNANKMRDIIRATIPLAQEVRIQLGAAALNGEFEFTPDLKEAFIQKLLSQERSNLLNEDLQKLLAFLKQLWCRFWVNTKDTLFPHTRKIVGKFLQ